ncbi:MAG: DUF2254 domain-containing protein [Ilumatobacter sp.]|uniref:DUF2254 domain-containing protein n=1 Tax=Ilumatobacter sp. TaxID=1967498 RepID=UPI003C77F406
MLAKIANKWNEYLNRLWVRITVISVLCLFAVVTAPLVEPILPERINTTLGTEALDGILTIIASSMLAVVTFSLSVMVSVYRSASSQWTPRIHRLMLQDNTTQNTLATFVGAYIFALSSIILLKTTLFQDEKQIVLLGYTVVILILIILAIVNWIVHLQSVGSLIDVTRRIENDTRTTFEYRMNTPCLGGHPLTDGADIPVGAFAVEADETGYVQKMFVSTISSFAERHDIDVYLHVPVGHFVHRGEILFYLSREQAEVEDTVLKNITIGDLRSFEQDPRFGLVVLGEIGSKALSPGINDAGTAIDVVGRMSRILESYQSEMDSADEDLSNPRIWVTPLAASDLIEDGFDPIARDGGGVIEVQLAVQKALTALARHPDTALANAAKEAAVRAFRRAERQLEYTNDLERLKRSTPADVQSST